MIISEQSTSNMLKHVKVQALSWTMDTAEDKGQRLARITYFAQKYPNYQLKTGKIQNIGGPYECSMSLTGIILFSE